jgi:hypothetical protein
MRMNYRQYYREPHGQRHRRSVGGKWGHIRLSPHLLPRRRLWRRPHGRRRQAAAGLGLQGLDPRLGAERPARAGGAPQASPGVLGKIVGTICFLRKPTMRRSDTNAAPIELAPRSEASSYEARISPEIMPSPERSRTAGSSPETRRAAKRGLEAAGWLRSPRRAQNLIVQTSTDDSRENPSPSTGAIGFTHRVERSILQDPPPCGRGGPRRRRGGGGGATSARLGVIHLALRSPGAALPPPPCCAWSPAPKRGRNLARRRAGRAMCECDSAMGEGHGWGCFHRLGLVAGHVQRRPA